MQSFIFDGNQPPEDAKKRREAVIAAALSRPAQNVGEGLGQLGVGLAAGWGKGGQAFPAVPGGAKPGFGALMGNLFTGRRNGGLT